MSRAPTHREPRVSWCVGARGNAFSGRHAFRASLTHPTDSHVVAVWKQFKPEHLFVTLKSFRVLLICLSNVRLWSWSAHWLPAIGALVSCKGSAADDDGLAVFSGENEHGTVFS